MTSMAIPHHAWSIASRQKLSHPLSHWIVERCSDNENKAIIAELLPREDVIKGWSKWVGLNDHEVDSRVFTKIRDFRAYRIIEYSWSRQKASKKRMRHPESCREAWWIRESNEKRSTRNRKLDLLKVRVKERLSDYRAEWNNWDNRLYQVGRKTVAIIEMDHNFKIVARRSNFLLKMKLGP